MLLKDKDLEFMNIMKVPGIFWAELALMLGMFNFTVYASFLSLRLGEFGEKNEDIGYIYVAQSGPYVVMCLLYQFIFRNVPPKLQYVIGLFIASIGFALMSNSSNYLLMPENEYIIIGGFAIIGACNVLLLIPNQPEIINIMTCHYKIIDGVDDDLVARMNDSASAIYQVSYNMGSMISPILGAALYN